MDLQNLSFNEYQSAAAATAFYPDSYSVIYPTLGLVGEAGEVAEKVKKILRDSYGVFTEEKVEEIRKELGDVLWYIALIAYDLNIPMNDIAECNINKLQSRSERGKLSGSGDNR